MRRYSSIATQSAICFYADFISVLLLICALFCQAILSDDLKAIVIWSDQFVLTPLQQFRNFILSFMQLVVGKHYELTKKVTAGSFGEIYHAVNKQTGQVVAVKLEPIKSKHQQLQYEAKLLAYLNDHPHAFDLGIPRLFYFGKNQNYNIMVMDLLGPSLEDLFQRCNRKFTLRTVVAVGVQIITRLEFMHSKKFIHRDIKPQNFLIGTHQNCSKVFIIDFGLSKKYIGKNGEHIPYKDNKSLTGTPRYASINSHLGIEQSRRDDLQSVIYMLIYFLKGSLPWQNLKADPNYDRYQKILEKKLSVSIQVLTQGLPPQFQQLVAYTRGLHFIEEPDYNQVRQMMRNALREAGEPDLVEEELYCWEREEEEDEQL